MSRAPATLVRLADVWRAALAASPHAGTVEVYLGPLVSGDPDDAVFVGYDGDPTGEFEMVAHTQGWVGPGSRKRDEEFDVRCSVLALTASTDGAGMAAAIARLYSVFAVLASAVHTDPSLGLGPGSAENAPVYVADVRGFTSFVPTDEERGVEPRVSFSVHVKTRV